MLGCGPGLPGNETSGSAAATTHETDTTATGTSTAATPTTTSEPSGATTTASDSTDALATASSTGEPRPSPPACGHEMTAVVGPTVLHVEAADFDLDGRLDLAARVDDSVQLWFGDGTGTGFTPGPTRALKAFDAIHTGDFDGDGAPDLLQYEQAGDVSILLNTGGDLAPPIASPVGGLYYTFRVADVDADGDDDISHGGWHSDPAHVWTASMGVLTATHTLSVAACYATGSDWADFDGDGDLDFAVIGDCNAVLETPFVTVHLREGDGYLAVLEAAQAHAADTSVLEAGDYDGDGILDLVTQGGYPAEKFELHRGRGDATFAAREPFPVPHRTQVLRGVDLDADGRSDLLADSEAGVMLYRSEGAGFTPCLLAPGRFAEVADFDGDERLDVMIEDGGVLVLARQS